jgi:hypothetical protein
MNYPGISTYHSPKPIKISKGVATTGVIHDPIFVADIAEQALAINLKKLGYCYYFWLWSSVCLKAG